MEQNLHESSRGRKVLVSGEVFYVVPACPRLREQKQAVSSDDDSSHPSCARRKLQGDPEANEPTAQSSNGLCQGRAIPYFCKAITFGMAVINSSSSA
mmetsp:Transcript_78969/g.164028  ORF Transcript_78969/g.164028 Transcript_78969/m.164028 type:complete len:97 (+) Transcript_78969:67-357(+)